MYRQITGTITKPHTFDAESASNLLYVRIVRPNHAKSAAIPRLLLVFG